MTNDQLHKDAVKLLIDRKSATLKSKDYNQRRRKATADLRPLLAQIWKAFDNGETVGGHCGKEDWAKSQSITIRQIQRIIAGTPQKRHDVALKVGMTVTVDGAKVVLTAAMLDLLIGTPPTPTPSVPPTGVEYVPNFLTPEQGDAFLRCCESLEFVRKPNPRNPKSFIKRSGIGWTDANAVNTRRNNDTEGKLDMRDAPPIIKEIRDMMSAKAGRPVNYLSLQKYADGTEHIGWHCHAEDHENDTPVLIVSCGETRTLSLRALPESKKWLVKEQKPFKKPAHLPTDTNIPLPQGSLLVMSPAINDTYLHAVLDEKNKGTRYSINAKCLPTTDCKPKVYDCHAGEKYPADAVYVGCRVQRGGKVIRDGTIFGNGTDPLKSHDGKLNPAAFREYAIRKMSDPVFRTKVEELRGRDLLCWCNQKTEADHCHANVWLELANS
jgi:alkylated DNA repair dioxygenase AlkB